MPSCNGTDTGCDITRRASELTSLRCGWTRALDEPIKGAMQMTAEPSAGAVSHIFTDWHSIPWKTVNEHVRRLQARIVQATKAGKWHKVASPATLADPFVQRQGSCRTTSDRKPRQEHPGRR